MKDAQTIRVDDTVELTISITQKEFMEIYEYVNHESTKEAFFSHCEKLDNHIDNEGTIPPEAMILKKYLWDFIANTREAVNEFADNHELVLHKDDCPCCQDKVLEQLESGELVGDEALIAAWKLYQGVSYEKSEIAEDFMAHWIQEILDANGQDHLDSLFARAKHEYLGTEQEKPALKLVH